MARPRSLAPPWLALACAALALLLWWIEVPFLELSELRAYDLRFRSREARPPSGSVVLALIDESSLEREGRWQNWPRSKFAALVDALSRDGAKVIAFDVAFPEPDQNSELRLLDELGRGLPALEGDGRVAAWLAERRLRADHDGSLARALERSSAATVLGYFVREGSASPGDGHAQRALIDDSKYPLVLTPDGSAALPFPDTDPVPSLELLTRAADSSGYFSVVPDADGTIRRMPLVMRSGAELFPPLSVLAAWHFLDEPQLVVRIGRFGAEGIQVGERLVPTDARGRLLVRYLGPPGTFAQFSVGDILAGEVAPGSFRDRIVLVGSSATGMYDLRTTPVGPVYPGVEIHATVIEGILSGAFLQRPDWAEACTPLLIVGLCFLCGLSLPHLGALAGLGLAAALAALVILSASQAFERFGIWLDVVYPLVALTGTYTALSLQAFVKERERRRSVRDAFARYVAPVVINEVLSDPQRLRLGGEEKLLTVLFSDLQGFTSYAEQHAPGEVFELLSEYYGRMTEQIFAVEGMLKEYVGDELVAIFGAPLDQPDHALRACAAALAMREQRRLLGDAWVARGRLRLRARTGINSGPMLVGNLGSEYRFSYGVLGDPVNLASRLEGLNRIYGTEILIGEQTAELVGNAFQMREVDRVRVVGREQVTRIHELIATADSALPDAQQQALASYAAGLEAYRAGAWSEAAAHFGAALRTWPGDGPSRVMAERSRAYAETPPPPGWGGVFELSEK